MNPINLFPHGINLLTWMFSSKDSNFFLAITDLVPFEVLPFQYKKFAINIQLNERSELDEC